MLDELVCDDSLAEEDREKFENLRQFFNLSSDFMWVLDMEGAIVAVNDTVTRRLGYSTDELRGRRSSWCTPKRSAMRPRASSRRCCLAHAKAARCR